ncbi:DDE_Tnp_1_7 domain-containing protein [Trichonephila inaurata madagascariensis]|uniref:DDE_Tnp_1_7 domain-containing protein n=1 Tax=Trichonephila inaurata madagascariensis TaxID=2747483 RepID=A0A8X6XNL3_9ARAC|nr:DDE_Tnp_1_7 domain-containing protein [Trichonephila inaurata madagascariensis]
MISRFRPRRPSNSHLSLQKFIRYNWYKRSDSESEHEYANLVEGGSEEDHKYSRDSKGSSENIAIECKEISSVHPSPFPQRLPFVAPPGSTFLLVDNFDILTYFELFFDNLVLDVYAKKPNRSDSQWKYVDKNEMIIILAINILQILTKISEEKIYWSTNKTWNTPISPKLMK